MTTLNISLPEAMQAFVEEQAAKGGFSTSEYILHLISQDQKQVAQTQMEAKLLEGLNSGEPIEVTDEWWQQKRSNLMQKPHQRQG